MQSSHSCVTPAVARHTTAKLDADLWQARQNAAAPLLKQQQLQAHAAQGGQQLQAQVVQGGGQQLLQVAELLPSQPGQQRQQQQRGALSVGAFVLPGSLGLQLQGPSQQQHLAA
jgi:hypothetical protein